MGRFNKKYILIIMLLGIFLLTGCNRLGFHASEENNSANVTAVPKDNKGNTDAAGISPTVAVSDTSTGDTPATDKELPIYTVDTEQGSGNIIPVTAMIPADSEVTPQLIVDKVIESLADQSIKVGCKSVTAQKDAVIVNFTKDQAPYENMGSEYEANILNAIAQSLIDNLDDYNKVIFRVDDKAYQSGSLEFGINDPYMEK